MRGKLNGSFILNDASGKIKFMQSIYQFIFRILIRGFLGTYVSNEIAFDWLFLFIYLENILYQEKR